MNHSQHRWSYAWVLLVACATLGTGLGRSGFWETEEITAVLHARHEETCRSFAETLAHAGMGMFGESEQGARLPGSILAILATLSFAVFLGKITDRRTG